MDWLLSGPPVAIGGNLIFSVCILLFGDILHVYIYIVRAALYLIDV